MKILPSFLLLAGLPGILQAQSPRGIQGTDAPELKVDYWIDGDGKQTRFSLADHENNWIVLKCFQSWCPGCHSHGLPAFKKLSTDLRGHDGVVFAGIQTVFEEFTANTIDKVRETQLEYQLDVPMGHDAGPDGNRSITMQDYRTGGTPWFILIAPDRKVVYDGFGIDTDKAITYLEYQLI